MKTIFLLLTIFTTGCWAGPSGKFKLSNGQIVTCDHVEINSECGDTLIKCSDGKNHGCGGDDDLYNTGRVK